MSEVIEISAPPTEIEIRPAQRDYLSKLFRPVMQAADAHSKAQAAFNEAVAYIKADLEVPSDYIFNPEGTKFIAPPKPPVPPAPEQ